MKDRVRGILYMMGGILCLVIGFAGIFLPVIPGIPLMLLGLHLLGIKMPFLDKHIATLKRWLEAKAAK